MYLLIGATAASEILQVTRDFWPTSLRMSRDFGKLVNVPRHAKSAQARPPQSAARRVASATITADVGSPASEADGLQAGRQVKSSCLKPLPRRKTPTALASERELWERWRTPEAWPGVMSVAEAAAYLRVSTDWIRDMTEVGRDGKSQLRHQRLPGKGDRETRRIRKIDLDAIGLVEDRAASN